MCVIVYKPGGVKFPPNEDLELMYAANDDGIGLMFAYKGRVYGKKFKQFKVFKEELDSLPRALPVMMHFRWATHGGNEITHAQPFPFPTTKESVYSLEWSSLMGIMHNGMISGFGDDMSNRLTVWRRIAGGTFVEVTRPEQKLSDTQEFLLFISSDKELTRQFTSLDRGLLKLICKLSSSKFGLLVGTGKARLVGKWEQKKGLWYSNMFWTYYRQYYEDNWTKEGYSNGREEKNWQEIWNSVPSPPYRGHFIG